MKNIWQSSEGDNYFQRNAQAMHQMSIKDDLVIRLLELYKIKPKNAIEIGCSNGYRLSFLHKKFKTHVTGVEPSEKAIADGKKLFPYVHFINDTCENFESDKKFDLVILHFVMHWFRREDVYNCLKNIDSLIEKNGYLFITDFGTDSFIKRPYKHQKNIFTYKMPYSELFSKSGNYLEIAKLRFMNGSRKLTPELSNENMGTIVLLKKKEIFIETE